MVKPEKSMPDDDWFVWGFFNWIVLTAFMVWGLWRWFGPEKFFFVWGLAGLTGVCSVNSRGLRKRKSFRNLNDKQMAAFHSVNVIFHMVLGPGIVIGNILDLIGYFLKKYSGDTASPGETT